MKKSKNINLCQAVLDFDNPLVKWPANEISPLNISSERRNVLQEIIKDVNSSSGKTKLISTLQPLLFHWLWETGRKDKSYNVTICPYMLSKNSYR